MRYTASMPVMSPIGLQNKPTQRRHSGRARAVLRVRHSRASGAAGNADEARDRKVLQSPLPWRLFLIGAGIAVIVELLRIVAASYPALLAEYTAGEEFSRVRFGKARHGYRESSRFCQLVSVVRPRATRAFLTASPRQAACSHRTLIRDDRASVRALAEPTELGTTRNV